MCWYFAISFVLATIFGYSLDAGPVQVTPGTTFEFSCKKTDSRSHRMGIWAMNNPKKTSVVGGLAGLVYAKNFVVNFGFIRRTTQYLQALQAAIPLVTDEAKREALEAESKRLEKSLAVARLGQWLYGGAALSGAVLAALPWYSRRRAKRAYKVSLEQEIGKLRDELERDGSLNDEKIKNKKEELEKKQQWLAILNMD